MSVERRIGLDAGLPQGLPDLSQSHTQAGAQRQPSDTDRQAFQQALAGHAPADDPRPLAEASPRPFPLAGLAGGSARAPAAAPAGLAGALAATADRLLVGDGSHGRREVRVELKDDVLPGVTVAVYEEGGRLVAAFVCASEASRETLCACAPALAAELAAALGRPALVRVTTDDPEDPCLLEAAADEPAA